MEYCIPLFVARGAATVTDGPHGQHGQHIDGYWMGLSKRSLQIA